MLLDPLDLRNIAVLLDVDGTILDVAPAAAEGAVSAEYQRILSRVAALAGGALALVSRRSLARLDRLFAPLRLPAIAGHGAEIRAIRNGPPQALHGGALDKDLKRCIDNIAARYAGVVVEDNGYSVGLDYRAAIECELDVISDVFLACSAQPAESFELITGRAIIEVKATGFNKGTAVRALMAQPPFAGRFPIFIGDDISDWDAFAVLPEFNGAAISVGRREPGILDTMQTAGDVQRWLRRLAGETAATGPNPRD